MYTYLGQVSFCKIGYTCVRACKIPTRTPGATNVTFRATDICLPKSGGLPLQLSFIVQYFSWATTDDSWATKLIQLVAHWAITLTQIWQALCVIENTTVDISALSNNGKI